MNAPVAAPGMNKQWVERRAKAVIIRSLKKFSPEIFEKAMEYVPVEFHAWVKQKMPKSDICPGTPVDAQARTTGRTSGACERVQERVARRVIGLTRRTHRARNRREQNKKVKRSCESPM